MADEFLGNGHETVIRTSGWFHFARCSTEFQIASFMSDFNPSLPAVSNDEETPSLSRQSVPPQTGLETVGHSLAREEVRLFVESLPFILIGLNREGKVTLWNNTAAKIFGLSEKDAMGRTLAGCGIKWQKPAEMQQQVSNWLKAESILRCDDVGYYNNGDVRFLGLSVKPIAANQSERLSLIITGADVTERKGLEEQLRQAHKLEAVGQLAAGIAHEINTPAQYVADNTTFLKESSPPIMQLLNLCQEMRRAADVGPIPPDLLERFDRLVKQADVPFLEREIPKAIDQSLEGLTRISKIVKAMKEFSHPGSNEKGPTDINRAIETTVTVARNEWKYVAEVDTQLDSALPPVPCLQAELNQVILNLIVNAAQAIASVVGDGSQGKGKITISTRRANDAVEIAIRDTGPGIHPDIQSRIFEPFFTTKPVGKGTGQGLAMAHSTIVKRHQGRIWFESELGKGTTFFIQLPLQPPSR